VQQRNGAPDQRVAQSGQPSGLPLGKRFDISAKCLDEQHLRELVGDHPGAGLL
jgi:hypothetical protein